MKQAVFGGTWLRRMMKASIMLALVTISLLAFSIRNRTHERVITDRVNLTAQPSTSHLHRHGFLEMKKIVVFSLYGNRIMDRDGALANALSVPLYYLTWKPVFVVDGSIPVEFQDKLWEAGGTVIQAPSNCSDWGHARQILRYLVLGDPTVEYAMFRDADSRISAREIASVNAWLHTNKTFHIMRDHPNHRFIIGGGMWGVHAARLRSIFDDIPQNILEYIEKRKRGPGCCLDQTWLHEMVWPLIGNDAVDHDSFHCGEYNTLSKPFPLPRDYHGDFVGLVQDTSSTELLTNGNLALWPEYRTRGEKTFKVANPERCRRQPQHIYG